MISIHIGRQKRRNESLEERLGLTNKQTKKILKSKENSLTNKQTNKLKKLKAKEFEEILPTFCHGTEVKP